MPTLETERLLLRAFAPGDWDALNAIVTQPGVTRYTHFGGWDERKRRAWLALMIAEAPIPYRNHWAITLRASGRLIGWHFIGCPAEEVAEGTHGCGYALDPRCWGQGYMPEALRAAIAYAFTTQGARRIEAECDTENAASARVMQKAGMTFVGRFYDADFEGRWAERDHYAITAPDVGG